MIIGAIGVVVVAAIGGGTRRIQKLPFLNNSRDYSAYFADAGGLVHRCRVQVSGFPAGKVSSIDLDGAQVLVKFSVDKNIVMGESTEAAIKTKSLLGTKMLDVVPRGGGHLDGPIPLSRTMSPVPAARCARRSGHHDQRAGHQPAVGLAVHLVGNFCRHPGRSENAVQGVARFAATLNTRDTQLRNLLDNAAKVDRRTGQTHRCHRGFGRRHQCAAGAAAHPKRSGGPDLGQHVGGVPTAQRIHRGNRQQLRPALDKLNGVLAIVDNRKERLQQAVKLLNSYAMSLGESVSSGPFFKAYVVNLLPGQFVQPFVDAAFSDLGLDPNVLLPSQRVDPQDRPARHPGAAGAVSRGPARAASRS